MKTMVAVGILWVLVMAGAAFGESGHNPHDGDGSTDSAAEIAQAVVDAIKVHPEFYAPRKFNVCRLVGHRKKCSRVFLEAVE